MNKQFIIICTTPAEGKAVIKYYKGTCDPVQASTGIAYCFRIAGKEILGHDIPEYYNSLKETIKVPFPMWAVINNVEVVTTATLKLTSDYSAVVDYKESIVNVGCQKIPFNKVEELHKLINQK